MPKRCFNVKIGVACSDDKEREDKEIECITCSLRTPAGQASEEVAPAEPKVGNLLAFSARNRHTPRGQGC